VESLGALFILIGFLLWIVLAVLWVWTLVDALRTPQHRWVAAGQSKVLWVLVLVGSLFVGMAFLGSVLYLLLPRPRLRAVPAY
jgi:hypothetical protein